MNVKVTGGNKYRNWYFPLIGRTIEVHSIPQRGAYELTCESFERYKIYISNRRGLVSLMISTKHCEEI